MEGEALGPAKAGLPSVEECQCREAGRGGWLGGGAPHRRRGRGDGIGTGSKEITFEIQIKISNKIKNIL